MYTTIPIPITITIITYVCYHYVLLKTYQHRHVNFYPALPPRGGAVRGRYTGWVTGKGPSKVLRCGARGLRVQPRCTRGRKPPPEPPFRQGVG